MLRELRAQVNAVLGEIHSRRKPALRRSDAPDALFATDLPLAAEDDAVDGFKSRILKMGWRIRELPNGWLLLDAPIPVPEWQAPDMPEGEPGCCIVLLQRHPGTGDATALIRETVKAAEAGKQPFERFCTRLHGELAAMLRRHEPLPGALLPYLCKVYCLNDDRRNTSC